MVQVESRLGCDVRLIVAEKGQHGRGVFGETPPVQIVRPAFLRTGHHSAARALVNVEAATGTCCPVHTDTDRHRLIQVLLRGAASTRVDRSIHTGTPIDLSITTTSVAAITTSTTLLQQLLPAVAIRQSRLGPDRHHQVR